MIHNAQKLVPVNVKLLRRNLNNIKNAMGVEKFKVNVWIYPDETVQKMNKFDRGVDSPTDILSYSELDLKPKQKVIYSKKNKTLGNLVLGINYIQRYCDRNKRPLDDYLERLMVHGMCHLTGYDHETDQERKVMRNREYYILKKLKKIKEAQIKEEQESEMNRVESADTVVEKAKEDEVMNKQSQVGNRIKKKRKKSSKLKIRVHYIDPEFKDLF